MPSTIAVICDTLKDFRPPPATYTEKDYPDLTGKNFLITGTSAGVGKQTATLLLSKNATLCVVNRNKAKTEPAINDILETVSKETKIDKEVLKKQVVTVYADLSDLTTLKGAAMEIQSRFDHLDVVILNAGVMAPALGSKSAQGYELQMGTNVIGHQLLLDLVTPLVLKAKAPRVLFLSSSAHFSTDDGHGLSWDFNNPYLYGKNKMKLYGQSKAGNIYQAAAFGRKHPGVVSLSIHPGFLSSDLQRGYSSVERYLMSKLLFPAKYGAYTELWAALHPDITPADSGKYVAPWGRFREPRADIGACRYDGTAEKLWDWVEEQIEQYK